MKETNDFLGKVMKEMQKNSVDLELLAKKEMKKLEPQIMKAAGKGENEMTYKAPEELKGMKQAKAFVVELRKVGLKGFEVVPLPSVGMEEDGSTKFSGEVIVRWPRVDSYRRMQENEKPEAETK